MAMQATASHSTPPDFHSPAVGVVQPFIRTTNSSGYLIYSYLADASRFDRDFLIRVELAWNPRVSNSLENNVLHSQLHPAFIAAIIWDNIKSLCISLDTIPHSHFITLQLRTMGSSPLFFVRSTMNYSYPFVIDYLLPDLPRQRIGQLVRIRQVCKTVTQVSLDNKYYAYKHDAFPPLHAQPPKNNQLVTEIRDVDRFRFSSSFVTPESIVVDDDGHFFRGYLMEWYTRGSLAEFMEAKYERSSKNLPPRDPPHTESEFDGNLDPVEIPWGVRLGWAADIVRAVKALHDASHPCGDLKLHNTVLCDDDRVKLIDFALHSHGTPHYLSPESITNGNLVTKERDIFAVGIILWEIAEEAPTFPRTFGGFPIFPWTNSSCPGSYRALAEACVRCDPSQRPSIGQIQSEIEAELARPT